METVSEMTSANAVSYSKAFYQWQANGSASSAATVVPLLLSMLEVKTVIDVGCGIGTWANEFLVNGVREVLGVDGDHVDHSQLCIPPHMFMARCLLDPLKLDRAFDAAVCLEVAEHLPDSRAIGLVGDLVALAPCVLFSAAVPGQGGVCHVNEQHLSYWAELFQRHGYEPLDAIRPVILGNPAVEWWYQQNIVLFVAPGHPLLSSGIPKAQCMVHRHLYDTVRNQLLNPTVGMIVKGFPGALARSLRSRLRLSRALGA